MKQNFRELATTVVNEHLRINEELRQIAKDREVSLRTGLGEEQAATKRFDCLIFWGPVSATFQASQQMALPLSLEITTRQEAIMQRSKVDTRKIRLDKDEHGYFWMCSQCFWRRSSPKDESDRSIVDAMREYNEHQCTENPAQITLLKQAA